MAVFFPFVKESRKFQKQTEYDFNYLQSTFLLSNLMRGAITEKWETKTDLWSIKWTCYLSAMHWHFRSLVIGVHAKKNNNNNKWYLHSKRTVFYTIINSIMIPLSNALFVAAIFWSISFHCSAFVQLWMFACCTSCFRYNIIFATWHWFVGRHA